MALLEEDYSALGVDISTQQLIAPVLLKMVADRAFAVGDQFICQSTLYKITASTVAIGTDLVVGTNCEISDTVLQQMGDCIDRLNSFLKASSLTFTKTNAGGNITVMYTGSVIISPTFTAPAGTYTPAITYNNRRYVSLFSVSDTNLRKMMPNAPTTAGTAISFGYTIYQDNTTYRDYTTTYLYLGTGSGTAANTWYLISNALQNASGDAITLSTTRYFLSLPFVNSYTYSDIRQIPV